jgi:hypothetical protein
VKRAAVPSPVSSTGKHESPFDRFTRNMRALMAVPKKELDEKIAAAQRQRRRRRASSAR